MWYGDTVEILLETEARSYYQIAVSPSGAIADIDRSAARNAWLSWDSQAEVATHIADDHWTVEIRIPVTQDENDPLHQVIGHKPTKSLPWHINVCDGSRWTDGDLVIRTRLSFEQDLDRISIPQRGVVLPRGANVELLARMLIAADG